MKLTRKFTEHPETVGESYGEHFLAAMGFGLSLLKAGFCCIVHAILPFMFEKTGSACISELHERMVTNRARRAERQGQRSVNA